MASEAEKTAVFNTNLLKWEVKTQNINAAFRRAELILLKRSEANAYKYVAERLQLWESDFANDDKRVKHYNIAKKVKELNEFAESIDNTLTFVTLRDLLSEINALDESFQAVAKTEVDIKKDAVAFLRDFTKDEELDVDWLKSLGEYEKKVGFLEASTINNENKWEENYVRYTPIPSLTSGAGSLGGLSHRFAMPEEIDNFCSPLGQFIDRRRTMPVTAQSKQISIPAGGVQRSASLNRQNRADVNTGAVIKPAHNEGPAVWSQAPKIAPKPQNRLMVHPTKLEEQAPSPANVNLHVGRQVYRNLSRLVDGEFTAFSPVSGSKWRPDLFPRRTETRDQGEARSSPPKSDLQFTAENHQNVNADAMEPSVKKEETSNIQCRTKILAALADSDEEIEHIHNLQTEPPSTKFSHSTSVKTLANNYENEADPVKKVFFQELFGRSQNSKTHGKPTPPMTEWSYQMVPIPRVIYRLARTQTTGTSRTKETPLREPSPQRFENAKSKVYQIAGLRQPVNCYTPKSADVSYLGKETDMDSNTQNSQVKATQLMNCNAGRRPLENLLEINNEVVPGGPKSSFAGRASYMSQRFCDVIRQWAHSHLQTRLGYTRPSVKLSAFDSTIRSRSLVNMARPAGAIQDFPWAGLLAVTGRTL
ncbi:hypothetical protein SprV_0301159100 [Sparganum proliferum]